MAEVAGLVLGAVGVLGVAGLYSTCLQTLDQIYTAKNLEKSANPLYARLVAVVHLYRDWGYRNGVRDGNLENSYHPALDEPSSRRAIFLLLANIEDMLADQERLSDRYGMSAIPTLRLPSNVAEIRKEMSTIDLNASKKGWKLRARWAITDKMKFASFIAELEVIVDRLFMLAPPQAMSQRNEMSGGADGSEAPRDRPGLQTILNPQLEEEMNSKLNELKRNIDSTSREAVHVMEQLLSQQRDLSSRYDDHERIEIFKWLQSVWTVAEYHESTSECTPGTCEWILNRESFHRWARRMEPSMESQVLWIHSPAGFGKTFLSAKIIAHFENTSSHPLAYFFCVHYDAEKKKPLSILRSFIAQIAAHRVDAFEQVKLARKGKETRSLSASELWSLFRAIITKVPFCRFVIDGFDECSMEDPEDRTHFTEARSRFLTNILSSIHLSSTSSLLIVSRDEADIREGLVLVNHDQQLMHAMEYAIREEDNQADIRLFAQHVTRKALRRHSQGVQEEVASELSSKAQGMFMWVRLEKDRLRSNQNVRQLRETLASMPHGMDRLQQMYGRSLLAISNLQEPSDRDRAVNILRWTLYATRPLSVRELLDVLIVCPEMTRLPEDHLPPVIDAEHVQQSITALCGSLVDIRSAENPSEIQNSTVHLAHFSVKEYLLSHSIFSSEHPEVFQSLKCHNVNHGLLAVSCLTYLSARQFSDWPLPTVEAIEANLAKYPLLKYAALSWATHAKIASSDQCCIRATQEFFASGKNLEHWDDVYQWSNLKDFYEAPRLSDPAFSLEYGIYFSAYFGLENALKVLLTEPNINLNYVGLLGTALQAASYQGEESVVKSLLKQGANPNAKPLSDGRAISSSTALQSASWGGYIGIVDLLLQHGADLLPEDEELQEGNALCLACNQGHEAIVRLMLEHGANVNGGDYLTPLEAASKAPGDLEGMVRLLLEGGADINARSGLDSESMGALQWASYQGNEAVVRLLLAEGADVNDQRGQFGNALQAASLFGRETIVLLLLDEGADVNAQGGSFGSALQAASVNSNEATVRLLLQNRAIVNSQGGHFGNALQAAAFGGHKGTVQLLIAFGANVNAQGGYYSRIARPEGHGPESGTALVAASHSGHTGVVQLLLASGADTNLLGRTWDNERQEWLCYSPLQLASATGKGREGVVRLLRNHNLDSEEADH